MKLLPIMCEVKGWIYWAVVLCCLGVMSEENPKTRDIESIEQPTTPSLTQNPISITANEVRYNVNQRHAIFQGDAHVSNGLLEIFADRIEVFRNEAGSVERIIIVGEKRVIECRHPNGLARGKNATYSVEEGILLITGNPELLYTDGTQLHGMETIVYNHQTGQFTTQGGTPRLIIPQGVKNLSTNKPSSSEGSSSKKNQTKD